MGDFKLLYVEGVHMIGAMTHWIDKDEYSIAKDKGSHIELHTFRGIFSFNKDTKEVTLNDGVRIIKIYHVSWEIL